MATMATNVTQWVLEAQSSAGNYQFIGIEFTNTANVPNNNGFISVMIFLGATGYGTWVHDIIFDRCWIHPLEDVTNPTSPYRSAGAGIAIDGVNNTIKNSYISGFTGFQSNVHSVSAQSNAMQISYGPGPITIDNNFIEGWGWNMMTGGSGALVNPANTATVTNATPSGATFSQTATLLVGDWVAMPQALWINDDGVQSLALVMRVTGINGTSVSWESGPNNFDPVVTGRTPSNGARAQWRGVHITSLTVTRNTFNKRQLWQDWVALYGLNPPKAVWEMKDGSNVLFEGNTITMPPAAMVPMSVALSNNQNGDSPWVACDNILVRNNLFRGLGRLSTIWTYWYHPTVPGTGTVIVTNNLFDNTTKSAFMETGAPNGTGEGWFFTHNTVRGITGAILFQLNIGTTTPNVTLRDNLMNSGSGWITSDANYPGRTEDHNLLINTSGGAAPAFTSRDTIVANDSAVGFVNVTAADAGGDYHGYALALTSPFKGLASDGKDPGVDFQALDAALGSSGSSGSAGTGSSLPAPTNLIVR